MTQDTSDNRSPLYPRIKRFMVDSLLSLIAVLLLSFVFVFNVSVDGIPEGIYGFAAFVVLPCVLGLSRALLSKWINPDKKESYIAAMLFPYALIYFGLFITATEGLICLLMAFPFSWTLSYLGWHLGLRLDKHITSLRATSLIILLAHLGIAGVYLVEYRHPLTPHLRPVTTQIAINAPPEDVWHQVITFSSLEEPDELLFKLGIAYPTHATIEGTGEGAIRRCEFSTGTFVEPITIWDEPKLLRFSVTENPVPMKELSIYENISPPHLHNTFYSEQGEFRLERQDDGSTILYGTTWYRQHIWPAFYWQQWSDYVIHKIHYRVLDHIKHTSEKNALQVAFDISQ